jgi:hypothetical protein
MATQTRFLNTVPDRSEKQISKTAVLEAQIPRDAQRACCKKSLFWNWASCALSPASLSDRMPAWKRRLIAARAKAAKDGRDAAFCDGVSRGALRFVTFLPTNEEQSQDRAWPDDR